MPVEKQGLKIALLSHDPHWMRVVANYCVEQDAFGWVDCYLFGKQLLAALEEGLQPEIIILDETMRDNDMDLLLFMQAYQALHLEKKPIVLGVCTRRHIGYTGELLALGMADFVTNPGNLQMIAERALRLYQEEKSGRVNCFCEGLYRDWLLEESDGRNYLTDAVKISSDATRKLAIRKEIIWGVAEHHDSTRQAIDSALRRVIDKLEKRQAPEYCAFKARVGWHSARPSVGQLVEAMKQALLQSQGENTMQAIENAREMQTL